MTCPKCKGPSKVLDTRNTAEGIRRNRQCEVCKHKFTTYEVHKLEKQILDAGMTMLEKYEDIKEKLDA